jgi:hypothetical protein
MDFLPKTPLVFPVDLRAEFLLNGLESERREMATRLRLEIERGIDGRALTREEALDHIGTGFCNHVLSLGNHAEQLLRDLGHGTSLDTQNGIEVVSSTGERMSCSRLMEIAFQQERAIEAIHNLINTLKDDDIDDDRFRQ